MSEFAVTVPVITAVSIQPNPAAINTGITVSVSVSDVEKILFPELRYSGTFYAGEE